MDSDGLLEEHALEYMVVKFENHPDLNVMTGAILTDPSMIQKYRFWGRLLRNLEFMEYAQAFLAGRAYASEVNAVYTLSGAFSAFRKSAVLSSWMYNTDTICEDTHITFQMRYNLKQKVEVCERAIFFTEPIDDMNKLYTQRQRWQRGSLEVAKMFTDQNKGKKLFDVNMKTLLYDHTFAFPRMIWYLALICLVLVEHTGTVVIQAMAMIFLLYIIIGFFYYFTVVVFLRFRPDIQKYYRRHFWCVFILPFFNFMVFFIRMAGIINSIGTDSSWKTKNLSQEFHAVGEVLKSDFSIPVRGIKRIRNYVNRE